MAQCGLNTINMVISNLLTAGVLVGGLLLVNLLNSKGDTLMRLLTK